MLEIVIVGLLFMALNYSVKLCFRKPISRAEDVAKAIRLRQVYRAIRLVIKVLFVLAMVNEVCFSIEHIFQAMPAQAAIRLAIGEVVIVLMFLSSMTLPISALSIHSRRKSKFALYLRGFEKDSYSASLEDVAGKISDAKNMNFSKKKETEKMENFNERVFFTALRKYMASYSVGRPSEIESPEGTKRIFLDNATWQQDVMKLINEATLVIVLVNLSESCLWEIVTSNAIAASKTIFIFDDDAVCHELKEGTSEQTAHLFGVVPNQHSIGYMKNDEFKLIEYENSKASYKSVLRTVIDEMGLK